MRRKLRIGNEIVRESRRSGDRVDIAGIVYLPWACSAGGDVLAEIAPVTGEARIVDQGGRNRLPGGGANPLPNRLVVPEEKGFIFQDGTADRAAELTVKSRGGAGGLWEPLLLRRLAQLARDRSWRLQSVDDVNDV